MIVAAALTASISPTVPVSPVIACAPTLTFVLPSNAVRIVAATVSAATFSIVRASAASPLLNPVLIAPTCKSLIVAVTALPVSPRTTFKSESSPEVSTSFEMADV